MADSNPRLPEQFVAEKDDHDFDVSELLSEAAGAHSPFGNVEFPVPFQSLTYIHPTPDNRPNLHGGN